MTTTHNANTILYKRIAEEFKLTEKTVLKYLKDGKILICESETLNGLKAALFSNKFGDDISILKSFFITYRELVKLLIVLPKAEPEDHNL